jgi:hypothetical protein
MSEFETHERLPIEQIWYSDNEMSVHKKISPQYRIPRGNEAACENLIQYSSHAFPLELLSCEKLLKVKFVGYSRHKARI